MSYIHFPFLNRMHGIEIIHSSQLAQSMRSVHIYGRTFTLITRMGIVRRLYTAVAATRLPPPVASHNHSTVTASFVPSHSPALPPLPKRCLLGRACAWAGRELACSNVPAVPADDCSSR